MVLTSLEKAERRVEASVDGQIGGTAEPEMPVWYRGKKLRVAYTRRVLNEGVNTVENLFQGV